MSGKDVQVQKEFKCASKGTLLYLPVITNEGVAYSFAALFEMFSESEGPPLCKVKKEPITFFPGVCAALHHHLWDTYGEMRKRRGEDDKIMQKYNLSLPVFDNKPEEEGEEGFLEEMLCAVSGEIAFEPCSLSSGTIVSLCEVPEGGFQKDPNRLIACALHNQVPKKSPALEAMIRGRFPDEYRQRGREVPSYTTKEPTVRKPVPNEYVHIGLGCDGCGMWPIRGKAYYDPKCPQEVGFHLCEGCYIFGYQKRVLTGRFNQVHIPLTPMEEMPDFGFL